MSRLNHSHVKQALDQGLAVVDIRAFREWDSGHPAGSLSVEWSRKSYPIRVLEATSAITPVVLVADDEDKADSATQQLAEEGWTVAGWADEDDFYEAGLERRELEEIDTAEMQKRIDAGIPLLDIREEIEREFLGGIDGAIFFQMSDIPKRPEDLKHFVTPGDQVVLLCSAGLRSATAASIMLNLGYTNMSHSPDGFNGWLRAEYPIVRD